MDIPWACKHGYERARDRSKKTFTATISDLTDFVIQIITTIIQLTWNLPHEACQGEKSTYYSNLLTLNTNWLCLRVHISGKLQAYEIYGILVSAFPKKIRVAEKKSTHKK